MPTPADHRKTTTAKVVALLLTLSLIGGVQAQEDYCLDVRLLDSLRRPLSASQVWSVDVFSIQGAIVMDRTISATEVNAVLAALEAGIDANLERSTGAREFSDHFIDSSAEGEFNTAWRLRLASLHLSSAYQNWAFFYRKLEQRISSEGIDVVLDIQRPQNADVDMEFARLYLHMAEISCRLDELEASP